MAAPALPPDVNLICGMISARVEVLDAAAVALAEAFGAVELVSETFAFDLTEYYAGQMGETLLRRFVAFEGLVKPDVLAAAKNRTNEIEAAFSERYSFAPRPVNLDVGYVTSANLVLASMKNFSHRIYLSDGVYAEVTLLYHRREWEALEWTFPDYASRRYDGFLNDVRALLRTSGRRECGK